MHRLLLAASLCLLTGGALAQTGGAPAGGAASSPGAAAPTAPGARPATPGAAGAPVAAPSSPAAPLNTDVFPPSRLLQAPAPSSASPAQSGSPAPSGAAAAAPPAGNALPGAPAAPDPNLPATASGGRPQSSGANSSPQGVRTGKNPITERYADCIKLWDSETHMSRRDWARTCRRIENRLQNLQVENMDVDVMGPKPRKSGKSSGGSG
jgi:hypothetical protein